MRLALPRRAKYALALILLALLVPVAVLAMGLTSTGGWGSEVTESALNLTASPGQTVDGWARVSVRWQPMDSSDAGGAAYLDVDNEATTLPGPYAVSALTLALPFPGDDGEYVWDSYRIKFQAPDSPGEYRYVVKWTNSEGEATGDPGLTINLKVG